MKEKDRNIVASHSFTERYTCRSRSSLEGHQDNETIYRVTFELGGMGGVQATLLPVLSYGVSEATVQHSLKQK